MPIHVLKTGGPYGQPVMTLCRLTGQLAPGSTDVYEGPSGKFRAVLPSHPTLGPTCKGCRLTAHAKKTDKQKLNMRLL